MNDLEVSLFQKTLEHSVRKLEAGIEKIRAFHANLNAEGGGRPSAGKTGDRCPEVLGVDPNGFMKTLWPSSCANYSYQPVNPTASIEMAHVYKSMSFDDRDGGVWKQGFPISYSPGEWTAEKPLRVFVVPHSHNDPGWIKTFGMYYKDQVRLILDNMVLKLTGNPTRKFIYAEMSFFSLWWNDIDDSKREKVKRLVEAGQLEIVSGGWVMPDEANTHYRAIIDQLVTGHLWMEENLGVKPKNGWAIDPFGHTPTMAYLLRNAGLENMLIQRVHYSVKKLFAQKKQLEFMWRPTWEPSSSNDILCHMMPFYSYDVPHTCGPDPKVCCQFDFLRKATGPMNCPWRVPPQVITPANVADRASLLLDQYRKKSQLYKSNVVLAPLGDDFRYTTPGEWDSQYNNYQALFDFMNSHPELHVQAQFGTLSDYFAAVREELGDVHTTLPSLSGDFFTYADRQDHYWSGYYTSRAFYKSLDRQLEAALHAAESIFALGQFQLGLEAADRDAFHQLLREAHQHLGLFQHHDGITGTAKNHVVIDYGNRLWEGLQNAHQVIQRVAARMRGVHTLEVVGKKAAQDALVVDTLIDPSTDQSIVIFNSLTHERSEIVSLSVSRSDVAIFDEDGAPILCQVSPHFSSSVSMNMAADQYKIDFVATIGALSTAQYSLKAATSCHKCTLARLTVANQAPPNRVPFETVESQVGALSMAFSDISVTLDTSTGTMTSCKQGGVNHVTSVKFFTYGTASKKDKSGAYLFLPDGPDKDLIASRPPIYLVDGPVVKEMCVKLPMLSHRLQISSTAQGQLGVLIRNVVDIRQTSNLEIGMRVVNTELDTKGKFYTDLNGFTTAERQTSHGHPIQANLFPTTSLAYVQDRKFRMSLLTAQSAGVSSLREGSIEVMMDRRLSQDDNRGLGQGVLDNKVTPATFVLRHETNRDSLSLTGTLSHPSLDTITRQEELVHPLVVMRGPGTEDSDRRHSLGTPHKSLSLPANIGVSAVRNVRQSKLRAPYVIVTLRNAGFDPTFPSLLAHCPGNEVVPSKVFSHTNEGPTAEVSLSGLHRLVEGLNTHRAIQLKPSELRTFELEVA